MKDESFLTVIKSKLISMKTQILDDLKHQGEDVDSHGDETDLIQAAVILGVNSDLLKRKTEQLSKIDYALEKLGKGGYGICVDCEEDIEDKRLLYNPWFETCIDCATDREKEKKLQKLMK